MSVNGMRTLTSSFPNTQLEALGGSHGRVELEETGSALDYWDARANSGGRQCACIRPCVGIARAVDVQDGVQKDVKQRGVVQLTSWIRDTPKSDTMRMVDALISCIILNLSCKDTRNASTLVRAVLDEHK